MVQCQRCGLLGLRSKLTRAIVEAEFDYRKTCRITNVPNPGGGGGMHAYDAFPLCLAREKDFRDLAERSGGKDSMLGILEESHNCPHFVEWHQGFTPKEHVEMQLVEEQRQWQREESERQREESERNRQWQEKQAREAETRHREQLDRQAQWHQTQEIATDRRHKSGKLSNLLCAIIGGLFVLAAVYLTKLL